jgi:hypothetical protein
LDYLTTHTSLSPIRREFAPGFVIYTKGCTQLTAASDKAYQLLVHGRWFSPGPPASSTTKTGCHDIAEILLKVALNTKNQIKSLPIKTMKSNLKVSTWIITSIAACPVELSETLVIMSVSTFKTDVILYKIVLLL